MFILIVFCAFQWNEIRETKGDLKKLSIEFALVSFPQDRKEVVKEIIDKTTTGLYIQERKLTTKEFKAIIDCVDINKITLIYAGNHSSYIENNQIAD